MRGNASVEEISSAALDRQSFPKEDIQEWKKAGFSFSSIRLLRKLTDNDEELKNLIKRNLSCNPLYTKIVESQFLSVCHEQVASNLKNKNVERIDNIISELGEEEAAISLKKKLNEKKELLKENINYEELKKITELQIVAEGYNKTKIKIDPRWLEDNLQLATLNGKRSQSQVVALPEEWVSLASFSLLPAKGSNLANSNIVLIAEEDKEVCVHELVHSLQGKISLKGLQEKDPEKIELSNYFQEGLTQCITKEKLDGQTSDTYNVLAEAVFQITNEIYGPKAKEKREELNEEKLTNLVDKLAADANKSEEEIFELFVNLIS